MDDAIRAWGAPLLGIALALGAWPLPEDALQVEPRGHATCCGLAPPDVRALYNDSGAFTGRGVSIVVVGPYAADPADVARFSQEWGLPPARLSFACAGLPGSEGCGRGPASLESTLDVEWLHAIAPDAGIEQIMPASANAVDLLAAYRLAAGRDARIVLTTWGACEQSVAGAILATGDLIIEKATRRGQLWVVASGDRGSRDCNGAPSVDFPASSPHVLAVGGTHVTCDSGGCRETAWSGSGGGRSLLFPPPAWQRASGASSREVPDVAAAAAPALRIVFDGAPLAVVGTSVAAPLWAGFAAQRAEAHPCEAPAALPARLAADRALTSDVTAGQNGDFLAGPGYDLVTGWGAPDAGRLVRDGPCVGP